MSHPCFVGSCDTQVIDEHVLCWDHASMVSKPARRGLQRTWLRLRDLPSAQRQADYAGALERVTNELASGAAA